MCLYVFYQRVWLRDAGKGRAAVLVVGDYGRSPRMQYHTVSLASLCSTVYIVADKGSPPCEDVRTSKRVDLSLLMGPILPPSALPWVFKAVFKVVVQSLRLPYLLLFKLPKCNVVLLQNPPALPILPIAVLVCALRGMHLVLDWHNLGYTLLEMDGRPKLLVTLYRCVERYFGRFSSANLCVCQSLERFLTVQWQSIAAKDTVVMYDCAPSFYSRGGPAELQKLMQNGGKNLFANKIASTAFTSDGVTWCADRPALLVSGTSWTIDEDVSMLIDALIQLDATISSTQTHLPTKVVAVITGKGGALKDACEKKIAASSLKNVTILTGFLDSLGDYARLVGCADFGVSLHNSSSGLDLPMKVVDMLGCNLPVAALHFPTLDELVTKHNGITFEPTAASVYGALVKYLTSWKVDTSNATAASPLLEEKRSFQIANPRPRWDDEWAAKVSLSSPFT